MRNGVILSLIPAELDRLRALIRDRNSPQKTCGAPRLCSLAVTPGAMAGEIERFATTIGVMGQSLTRPNDIIFQLIGLVPRHPASPKVFANQGNQARRGRSKNSRSGSKLLPRRAQAVIGSRNAESVERVDEQGALH